MPIFEHDDIRIEIDDHGFITKWDDWNEKVAAALARADGIDEISEQHWKVINYLRDYYKQFGIAPMVRKLCKETGLSLKEIYELFPSGPANGACKIAGLAKPTGCV
jgi:dissimilatory sulfite reductase related protein